MDPVLDEFLGLSEAEQLDFLETLTPKQVRSLYARFAARAKRVHDLGKLRAYPRMLELIDPEKYLPAAQETDLRLRLTPEALRRLRLESQRELMDALERPLAEQVAFVNSLDADGLRDLLRRLERYIRVHGWVPLYDVVKNRVGG